MSVEVEFVGGMRDGEVRALPVFVNADAETGPPPRIVFQVLDTPPALWEECLDSLTPVPVREVVYLTRVNPADHGPLWIAVPEQA